MQWSVLATNMQQLAAALGGRGGGTLVWRNSSVATERDTLASDRRWTGASTSVIGKQAWHDATRSTVVSHH